MFLIGYRRNMSSTVDPVDGRTAEPTPDPAPAIGRTGAYAKGVARRQEILDRALEVFRERGAAGTSLRSIAETLGVSHAALLHYFASREQLLVAVYEHHERRREELPDEASATDVVTRVTSWATANIEVPGLVELYTTLVAGALAPTSPVAREHFSARFDRVRTDLAERLREDQAAGIVRDDIDPDQVAALIIAASDGLQVQWLLDRDIPLEDTLHAFGTLLRKPEA